MSLSDGSFNLAARGLRDMFGVSARIDLPEDGYSAEVHQGPWQQVQADPLEMLVGRQLDNQPDGPEFNAPEGPETAQPAALNLQNAFTNARDFQKETVKLEAGKITAASGPGAKAAGDYIDAKATAVDNLQAAVAQSRKEATAEAPPASSRGPGIAGVALSAAAGVVADTIMPGAGVAMTVAGMAMTTARGVNNGKGSFGEQNHGEFASPSSDAGTSVYQATAGHDMVDIMQTAAPAAPQGPQFSLGDEEIASASLTGITRMTLGGDQLAAAEKALAQMKPDVEMGGQMFKRWTQSDVDVTTNIGDTPVTALKVSAEDEALLTRDNPRLEQMAAAPKVNAMKLI